MVKDIEVKDLLHGRLNVLDARVAEFHHLMTIRADQVIMLFVSKRFLILGEVLSKLVFGYQVAFHQQIKGVVNRCTAHPIVLVLHADVKRLHIKMAAAGIDLLQDRVTLGGLPQLLIFQISSEDLLYFLVYRRIKRHILFAGSKITFESPFQKLYFFRVEPTHLNYTLHAEQFADQLLQ